MSDRILPHDLEAERAVIGSVMIDYAEYWPVASAVLVADHFFAPAHSAIWSALDAGSKAHASGTVVDSTMVRGELDRAGKIELAGEALLHMLDKIPEVGNVDKHAMTVRNLAVVRAVANKASAIVSRAYSGAVGDLTEFLDESEHALSKVCDARAVAGTLNPIKDVVTKSYEGVVERAERQREQQRSGSKVLKGYACGLEDVDNHMSGFWPGLTYFLAGRPGMGKTSAALSLVCGIAENSGKPGIFFSLEMLKEQLCERMLSSKSEVDGRRLQDGSLTRDDWPRMAKAAGALSELPMFIDDECVYVEDICRVARRKSRECGGLSIIAVDYVQRCRSRGKFNSKEEEIAHISMELTNLAKELKCVGLPLAQLNRGTEGRPVKGKGRRPEIADLRGSGAIEQDADAIIFLYRDEVYNPESEDRGLCELIVAKWRYGATGIVKCVFRKEFTRLYTFEGRRDDDGDPGPNYNDPTQERHP